MSHQCRILAARQPFSTFKSSNIIYIYIFCFIPIQIEVDADGFKYVIAHTGVTPDYLTVLYGSWTTNT